MRIINTKEDIRQALISKGYDVPTSIPFKEYAKMISDLPCRVDSFPDIEGIVARYSALGLTNEQMAANPVWVDKTGNGHDLQMKNFAWKEGSGISDIYPGALVFDGVDDYGTCDNFPVLTKEKGYTVVALRQYLVEKSTAYLTANGDSIPNTSFIFEGNNYKDTWNFGKATGIQASRILATQTSKQYDGVKLNIGTNAEGSNLLQVGKWSKSYSNVAIWELVFLDHDATEEELTKIKDYFVKTYPWLFFDQAWTVTGKTNEDEDRATIANITGNSNDLVLSNFGFVEGSGYNEEGEYAGYLVTDGVDDKVVSAESIAFTDTWTIITDTVFLGKVSVASGILASNIFTVYNYQGSGTIAVTMGEGGSSLRVITSSIKAFSSDGTIYDAEWNEYHVEIGTIRALERLLKIGTSSNETSYFCQLAFKFLGIYNNQILSKDDCIKAYNYLQTLKAK
jgi:hypothetical protein